MWTIVKRELINFFWTPQGYVLLGTFFILNGLMAWVFPTPFNLLDAGFGDLYLFFELNPWILVFFIPALGMKSFTEEIRSGTLNLLLSKPLSRTALVMGKFIALLCILFVGLTLAFFYLYIIHSLLIDTHSIDMGVFIGSFLGLFLLATTLVAISIWASTLVGSPFTAFFIAFFVSIFHFYGWQQMGNMFSDYSLHETLSSLALHHHYSTLNKGVIRISNLFYLLSQTALFLYGCSINLKKHSQ